MLSDNMSFVVTWLSTIVLADHNCVPEVIVTGYCKPL